MKKIFSLFLALLLIGGGVSFADVQIDEGQNMSASKRIFFVGRFASANVGNNFSTISKDRTVVWDTNSNDGVTVKLSTTSADKLNVGVAIDDITVFSSDNTAANGLGERNWGRIQTWGRYANADISTTAAIPVGSNLCVGATAGVLMSCMGAAASEDNAAVGVALEAITTSDTDIDVMLNN